MKNRPMKIRHASITTGIRVKNLTPNVSNELLEKAFKVFGLVSTKLTWFVNRWPLNTLCGELIYKNLIEDLHNFVELCLLLI